MNSLKTRYRLLGLCRHIGGCGDPARIKKLLVSLIGFPALFWACPAFSQTGYWQQSVNYRIDVSLNDVEHTLDGFVNIQYSNHSPDTLRFIWFHVWPNAYKSDQTAFSDQLLENGKTDFYFSDKEERGYINRLDFRVDGVIARMEDHPQYIDIIKVILPAPLAPGNSIQISTPFHEKLPNSFSRGGHTGQSYQITQWYPKPAVYDAKGWHPLPYLDQGEFYAEFGNYEVHITLPKNYAVAATGDLQNEEEQRWLLQRINPLPPVKTQNAVQDKKSTVKKNGPSHPKEKTRQTSTVPPAEMETKTLVYKQEQVHDFAWFADKEFIVQQDTIQLNSGRIIRVYSFYRPENIPNWTGSLFIIKKAVRFYSATVGEYPYHTVTAVGGHMGFNGGMEYPTITLISIRGSREELESAIVHEVGHNWFYGILGSNERRYPWMDEGINTYYQHRYKRENRSGQPTVQKPEDWLQKKIPTDPNAILLATLEKVRADQPISTSSESFTELNYYLIAYEKTAQWMNRLEDSLGQPLFDRCMQQYFEQWKFKHPNPENFKAVVEAGSGKSLNYLFDALDQTGPISKTETRSIVKPSFLFSARNTDKYNYINFLPAIGYNLYDQLMIGLLIHNFNLPPRHFQFLLAPVYATGSRQLDGLGLLNYSWFPDRHFQKVSIGISGSRFSSMSGTDSSGHALTGGFYKVVPSIRLIFKNKIARSQLEKSLEFKTFIIGEKNFDYVLKSSDNMYYPQEQKYSTRYLNQLSFNIEDYRVLYPYTASFQAQQSNDFYRIQFTGNYFFNYAKAGGLELRFFAAKFGYIGDKTTQKEFETTNYQPKLTAVRGTEDYTYSNYFIGRNETTGFSSQQVMMRDGGLKLRTDLFQGLQGRSDNWVASLNLNTTLPNNLFPIRLPIRIFFDLGTYSEAWGSAPPTSRFLYVTGFQISVLKDILNIYIPIVYSSDFSNSFKTVPEENTFWKRISFSIDLQQIKLRKISGKIPVL